MSTATDKTWLDVVVADLRDYAVELLEVGLSKPSHKLALQQDGSLVRPTIHSIELYCQQVPYLLAELNMEEGFCISDLVTSATPHRSLPSRSPADYTLQDGKLVPHRWLQREMEAIPPVEPLRWILGIGQSLQLQLDVHIGRIEKQIETARIAREGTSTFAVHDLQMLDLLAEKSSHMERQLSTTISGIHERAGRRLSPVQAIPTNLPRTASWQRFRRQAFYFSRPRLVLGSLLKSLLSDARKIAHPSFLYQRWCGLQLIEGSRRLGWTVSGDVVGALFLGGPIHMRRENGSVDLWVETRLSPAQEKRIGWSSDRDEVELTPDFMFITGRPGNRDCYVLDATLNMSEESLNAKMHYRQKLVGSDARIIAGVPTLRRPLRSWAIAPLESSRCQLRDLNGIAGVIPLNPLKSDFAPVEAWLADVFAHALLASSSDC